MFCGNADSATRNSMPQAAFPSLRPGLEARQMPTNMPACLYRSDEGQGYTIYGMSTCMAAGTCNVLSHGTLYMVTMGC